MWNIRSILLIYVETRLSCYSCSCNHGKKICNNLILIVHIFSTFAIELYNTKHIFNLNCHCLLIPSYVQHRSWLLRNYWEANIPGTALDWQSGISGWQWDWQQILSSWNVIIKYLRRPVTHRTSSGMHLYNSCRMRGSSAYMGAINWIYHACVFLLELL